jgi:PKD repeat protein
VVTPDDSATASIEIEEAEQPEAPTTGVSLSPSEQTVGVGDSVTYDVVVDSAAGGVGSIDLTVSTDDASIAEISSIEAAGEAAYVESTVLSDGTSATLDAVGLDTAQSGPVTVATVTVTGVSADGTSVASTDLSIDVESLGTEGAVDYEVTGTSGATVTVQPAEFLVSDLDAPDGVVRGEPVTVTADVTNDGSITTTKTVQFRFDLNGDGTLSEGETVATTQLKLDPGETQEVTLTAVVPEDTPLGEYDHGVFTVDDSQSATIDVTLAKLDSQYEGPPQDLDGDGLYEDVNGNGEVNLNDVQALFVNRDSAVIQENGALFDFNGNGEFNNVDIQKFFTTISQSN